MSERFFFSSKKLIFLISRLQKSIICATLVLKPFIKGDVWNHLNWLYSDGFSRTVGMGLCIIHFKESQVDISQSWCSSVLGDYFILTNSVDPDCGISSGSSLFAKVPVFADSFKKGCCLLQAKVCARITGYPLVQACPGKSVVK